MLSSFDDLDLAQLRARGVSLDDVQHQLLCFRNPPAYADVVRPCTVSDGILRIEPEDRDELLGYHAAAAAAGRLTKFVPASGAATRMFGSLAYFRGLPADRRPSWDDVRERASRGTDPRANELAAFLEAAPRLAFAEDLDAVLRGRTGRPLEESVRDGDWASVLDALLADDGLGYAGIPKGLVPFHRYEGGERRTAFEEHLVEAAATVRETGGMCRLHFTVAADRLDGFASLLREVGARYAERYGVAFDIAYSVQKPSTDTIAVDPEDRPFRTGDGRILFRPGGHGALIENLEDLEADIVLIKNIDNVQHDARRDDAVLWKKLLTGVLVRCQDRAHDLLHRLKVASASHEDGDAVVREAETFVRETFGVVLAPGAGDPATRRAAAIDRLDRPIRVCGMVRNTGEPGGGPFWVRDRGGTVTPQVVESAQIDPGSEDHQALFRTATHFNPVDLVCALRDASGAPYALHPLVDSEAVIVTRKLHGGAEIKVLERPGLWNGAMAGWNTVFVEVPLESFTPVKTVSDLERPAHRG